MPGEGERGREIIGNFGLFASFDMSRQLFLLPSAVFFSSVRGFCELSFSAQICLSALSSWPSLWIQALRAPTSGAAREKSIYVPSTGIDRPSSSVFPLAFSASSVAASCARGIGSSGRPFFWT